MKRRPSLLKKIWRKLLSPKPVAKLHPPERRKVGSSLESLEGRISPAALINASTVMYKDFDGDIVTVKFSKSIFTSLSAATNVANANTMLKFTNAGGNATTLTAGPFNPAGAAEQLRLIDINAAPLVAGKNVAAGVGISIAATKVGDGFVDVGYIKSTAISLGAVSIAGDLGQIDAGGSSATGLTLLKVKSLGQRDATQTQLATGRSLVSNITGAIGSITVTDDINTASIITANGVGVGKIGSITIGGSLKGLAGASGSDSTGLISSSSDIGAVKIGTLLTQGIVGGGGTNSGSIQAVGKIAGLTVSGNLAGSTGTGSGSVHADGALGAVIVKGNLSGGSAKDSGSISAASIGAVSIGGSIMAGGNAGSGVLSSLSTIGAVKIGGNLDGTTASAAAAIGAGGIRAAGKIAGVAILGDLKGGAYTQTGFIDGGNDIGSLTVRSIHGGNGVNSGTVTAAGKIYTLIPAPVVPGMPTGAPTILGVTVNGDIFGGAGAGSGSIFSGLDPLLNGDIGKVVIAGKIIGGGQTSAGSISAGGKIGSVTIGPKLAPATPLILMKGGAGNFSGSIVSHGAMGAVKITGHVEGGGGDFSGSIISRDVITDSTESAGSIGAVAISGHLKGGAGDDSGVVRADGNLTGVSVGDLLGAGGARSGSIRAGEGSVQSGIVGAVTVKGVLAGAGGVQSGAIISEGSIKSVSVTGAASFGAIRAGDNLGTLAFGSDVTTFLISARGQAVQSAAADLAIAKITIAGNATDLRVRAGIDTASVASNPDAQIGTVAVKGSWTRGDIVAGVTDGGAAGFGTTGDVKMPGFDNPKIISQIASITVTGGVVGTAAAGDHFGFTAQKIGAMKIGPTVVPFSNLVTEQFFELLAVSTNDFTAREVPV